MTDQTTLRDRIAEALMRWAERGNSPQYAAMRRPETVRANAYSRADAVLAVLPASIDRAAVLREAANALEAEGKRLTGEFNDSDILHEDGPAAAVATWKRAADRLRRMADETQPAQDDRLLHACVEFDTWFDRNVCSDPCGVMHTRCTNCGVALDACPHQPAAGAQQDGAQP